MKEDLLHRWFKNEAQHKGQKIQRLNIPFLPFSVCLILYLVQTVQAQTAILEYKFNETGTTAPSTGSDVTAVTLRNSAGAATDLHSADSLGVSGLTGDLSPCLIMQGQLILPMVWVFPA